MASVLLDSSLFRTARYSEPEQFLDLEFRSGAIYRYFGFPLDRYAEFMKANSHGAHLGTPSANLLKRSSSNMSRGRRCTMRAW
jgi:hypothetical protein